MPARHAVVAALALALALSPAAPAGADECASYGLRADLDGAEAGRHVAANVAPRVLLAPSCGAPEGGPDHEFRLLGPGGEVVTPTAVPWGRWFVELQPPALLAGGGWRLEVRRPRWSASVDAVELGPWEAMASFWVVADLVDRQAPAFDGIVAGEARPVAGTVMLSPCEAESDWVVETHLTFAPAFDTIAAADDLLYLLERRSPGGDPAWSEVTTFRPERARGGRVGVTLTDEWGWGERWEYRISVRDPSGNQRLGERTLTVTAPKKPKRPVPPWRR
ncbi:MAG: hypothetical protein H6711_10100 [Myxococcales bacterium]|nr:hypothetical protein [Myxococcales bacterium]